MYLIFIIPYAINVLFIAFKKITDITGKNLVFAPGIGNQKISSYIKDKSFESAIDKIAFANNLSVTKTKDDYYLFESAHTPSQAPPPRQREDRRTAGGWSRGRVSSWAPG